MMHTDPRHRQTMGDNSAESKKTKSWMKSFFTGSMNSSFSRSSSVHHHPEIDLSYITSRFIVLCTPREQISDAVRTFLDGQHPQSYSIYSVEKPASARIFDDKNGVRLSNVLKISEEIQSYLSQSPSHVAVLHSHEGKNQLAFAACALLAREKLFEQVEQIVQYYDYRRSSATTFTLSQKRYLQYLLDVSLGVIERPHGAEVILKAIHFSPIPLFNRQRTGCRPFVEIFDGEQKKISSTYQEANKIQSFTSTESSGSIPINLAFTGDLTIHLFHAPVGISLQDRGIRICQLRINSNFSTNSRREISFAKTELEQLDQIEKYPSGFRLWIETSEGEKPPTDEQNRWAKLFAGAQRLFHDQKDSQEALEEFGKISTPIEKTVKSTPEAPTSPSPVILRPQNELTLSDSWSSGGSSSRLGQRLSATSISTPQSPSSFTNPFHNPLRSAMDISPRTSQISVTSSPPSEERRSSGSIAIGNLLEIDGFSLDVKHDEFTISSNSHGNPLEDDPQPTSPEIISPTTLLKPSEVKKNKTQSVPQPPSVSNGPNYNVTLETKVVPPTKPTVTVTKPPKPKIDPNSLFAELNGETQFTPKPVPVPNTMAENQKAKLAKEIDPTVFKVREWTEGKKRNIRALLCSLSTVTWPECRWEGCQMHELVTADQVKKAYRKAVLHIHPDKLRGDPNEALAKLIFVELNEGWSQFEGESNQ